MMKEALLEGICTKSIKNSAKHPFLWYNLPINAVAR